MNWTTLAPAVFSLAGVAIGTVGSLTVGYFTTRTAREQTRVQQAAAFRAERKDTILEYLRAMQAFHDFVLRVWEHAPDLPEGHKSSREAAQLESELWFYQKKLLLVASEPLRKASLSFTEKLDEALYQARPAGVEFWDFIDPAQDRFIDAARSDLGISVNGLPLRRRSSARTD
jgi:hypothetical protein